jgi:hypothetical protein
MYAYSQSLASVCLFCLVFVVMCVYMCVCVHTCLFAFLYLLMCVCVCVRVCAYLSVSLSLPSLSPFIHVYACICIECIARREHRDGVRSHLTVLHSSEIQALLHTKEQREIGYKRVCVECGSDSLYRERGREILSDMADAGVDVAEWTVLGERHACV